MYSALVFLLLMTMGEILYKNENKTISVIENTYSLRLYTKDRVKVESIIDSLEDYADICVISEEKGYSIVSFASRISPIRSSNNISVIIPGELKYNSETAFIDLFRDKIDYENDRVYIHNFAFVCAGETDINISAPIKDNLILYLDYEDFWSASESENVILSIMYNSQLSDAEADRLSRSVSSMGVVNIIYRPDQHLMAIKLLHSNEVHITYLILILAGLCMARLLILITEKRKDEYQIMRYCGASIMRIYWFIFQHFFLILILSVIVGSLSFIIVQTVTNGMIICKSNSIGFYLFNVIGFLIITMLTSILVLFAAGKKHDN